jgi:hypothetical protein
MPQQQEQQQQQDVFVLTSNQREQMVWIPPRAKDRSGVEVDDDDFTEARNERGQSQLQQHHEVLNSMDLIVDGQGFLMPRKGKTAADEATVDNEICWCDEDDHSEAEESSSSGGYSSSQEEEEDDAHLHVHNKSLSSIPYCQLMPDGFAPQTPSGHRSSKNGKSFSTLETEAMTRTISDSQTDMFASPRPSSQRSERSFRSPKNGHIPSSFDVLQSNQAALVSPLPEPSPSGRSYRRSSKQRVRRYSDASDQNAFYIPGLTSPSGSVKSSASKEESRKKKTLVLAGVSPIISTSRISMVAKQMATTSPSLASPHRSSPRNPSRQSLQRHRSDSAADQHHEPPVARGVYRGYSETATKDYPKPSHMGKRGRQRKQGKERHFVPGNTEDILRGSPKQVILHSPPTAAASTSHQFLAPVKTPSSSSRETVLTTGMSLSNSTGRATVSSLNLESHFYQEELLSPSSKSPSRRSRRSNSKDVALLDQIGALDLLEEADSLDEDISSAGAVIIQTRKVLKTPTTNNRKKNHQRRSEYH